MLARSQPRTPREGLGCRISTQPPAPSTHAGGVPFPTLLGCAGLEVPILAGMGEVTPSACRVRPTTAATQGAHPCLLRRRRRRRKGQPCLSVGHPARLGSPPEGKRLARSVAGRWAGGGVPELRSCAHMAHVSACVSELSRWQEGIGCFFPQFLVEEEPTTVVSHKRRLIQPWP